MECVGIDAATGREVPRSYVDWLEKRVQFLEREMGMATGGTGGGGGGGGTEGSVLETGRGKRKLSCSRSEAGGDERRRGSESNTGGAPGRGGSSRNSISMDRLGAIAPREGERAEDRALHLRPDIENLVSQVGLVSVQGTSAPGFVGGSSGISYDTVLIFRVPFHIPSI